MAGAALLLVLLLATPPAAADDPFGPGWPEGEGREEVGYFCSACHSLDLVKQQGLSRDRWDHLLTWMTETQNMPPLEGEERVRTLDYLATHFGEEGEAGSGAGAPGAAATAPGRPGQGVALPPLTIRP